MKYLKKLIILLILFIPVFTNAKEKLTFEWGSYIKTPNQDYFESALDVVETKEGYLTYGINYAIYYDKDGNITNKYSIDDYCNYIKYDEEKEQFLCFTRTNYQLKALILDKELKVLKSNILTVNFDFYIYDEYYFNETENEYIIISPYDISLLVISKDLSSYKEITPEEMTEEEIRNYYGEYYLYFDMMYKYEDNRNYYRITYNDKYILLIYYDFKQKVSGIEIYDKEYNQVLEQQINTKNQIIAELTNDGYYIVTEEDISDRKECQYNKSCYSQLEISKYNFKKEKEYSEELQTLVSIGYHYYYNDGRKITTLKKVDNGLIFLTNYIYAPRGREIGTPEETISGELPTITKYYFTYDILTKTDGKGTIKVIDSAKSGDGVTFEITPKEGYVLGVVKVTDKDGNVLTFTDYKFTMPSSDVTIEATFLPENPETSDLITYIILLFGLTTLFIVYIKNEQKRKYYKNIK